MRWMRGLGKAEQAEERPRRWVCTCVEEAAKGILPAANPSSSPEQRQRSVHQQGAPRAQQRCAAQHAAHPRVAQSHHELCTTAGSRLGLLWRWRWAWVSAQWAPISHQADAPPPGRQTPLRKVPRPPTCVRVLVHAEGVQEVAEVVGAAHQRQAPCKRQVAGAAGEAAERQGRAQSQPEGGGTKQRCGSSNGPRKYRGSPQRPAAWPPQHSPLTSCSAPAPCAR